MRDRSIFKDLMIYLLIALAFSQAGFIYGYRTATDAPHVPVIPQIK